ncbi:MAG: bifunctional DNA-formamidopyrimidine glycosylase/DNA-(apurinic or apyrimidinic site) lyase [Dehalobacterium sp.]
MPELPEVETVKQTLSEHLIGLAIKEVWVNHETVIKTPGVTEFKKTIIDKIITCIERRGKYLIFSLSQGLKMIIHLRMTGQLVYVEKSIPMKKHTHVVFGFGNDKELRFTDQRRFGRIWLVGDNDLSGISGLSSLGPEPLDDIFCLDDFRNQLAHRKTRIKPLLLDQTFIAGIGNIYADEILFRSQIHPERSAQSLSEDEILRLFEEIRNTLREAVVHRGTTFSDYVDGRGEKGSHQNYLNVYQQIGEKCPRCGTIIERVKVGSRSAYHCPGCQK